MISSSALAAPVEGTKIPFESPAGLTEYCIRLSDLPGAVYSKKDREEESDYCSLDLYRHALCPKLWSTSPGTIVYEVDEGQISAFEQAHCASGHHAKAKARDKPATFKMSVNARDTSATYAPSSWVYYHFSRFLMTQTYVPVAVYRSMDASKHHERVVQPALQILDDKHGMRMLAAGWRHLDEMESQARQGKVNAALFTDEGRQVYGVLLDGKGDRYGAEFNGTRESGWGSGQNMDFQQTAAFLALRSPLPLEQAASQSIQDARNNPRMAKALRADVPVIQVIFWMQDVLEITLLDYILGQQDRIGNIDYIWRWAWQENGRLQLKTAHGSEIPENLVKHQPIRIRQSAINDNDAGVRRGYADFASKTHMLEGLRHYSPRIYRQLGQLAANLQAGGSAHQWLVNTAGLSSKEAFTISERAQSAYQLLSEDCKSGRLKLDLDPVAFLAGEAEAETATCE